MRLIDADAPKWHTEIHDRDNWTEIPDIEHAPTIDAVPVTRCEHCEEHRNRVGICDVWHAHTPPWGWCYRGRKYGKND